MIPEVIRITRKWYTSKSTVSNLTFNDWACHVLEDTVRKDGFKIYGRSAIPSGKYEVIINFSERFKRPMPLLLEVPGFEGIRIHSGNTSEDTEGCLLLGKFSVEQPDFVSESRETFAHFFPKLEDALKTSKVYVSIT